MNETDSLDELKSALDTAVRGYETALMRTLLDENEIRRAVDRCTVARQRLNEASEALKNKV